jgi:hypothetical protein
MTRTCDTGKTQGNRGYQMPGAGLGDALEGVAAIPTQVAAGSGADLAACDLAADIVLWTIG